MGIFLGFGFVLFCFADQSEVFERMESPPGTLVVKVSEKAVITEVFIQWAYYQDANFLENLSFEELVCLLNMACQYEILKLMGMVSRKLIDKLDCPWQDKEVWRLYCIVRTVEKIQIVVQLKEKIKESVLRCVLETLISSFLI